MDNNYLLNVEIHMKNHCYTSHVNLDRVSRFDGISSFADAHPTRCYTAMTIRFTEISTVDTNAIRIKKGEFDDSYYIYNLNMNGAS